MTEMEEVSELRNSRFSISMDGLKLIACISMLIDHITFGFIPEVGNTTQAILYVIGRCLGRPAFIIFCFALVEGFFYTHSKKKHLILLLIFALISELPFDLLVVQTLSPKVNLLDLDFGQIVSMFLNDQNVGWTLLIGFIAVWIIDTLRQKYEQNLPYVYYFYAVTTIVVSSGAAQFLKTDYGAVGVLCVLFMYYLRGKGKSFVLGMFAWSIVCIFFEADIEWVGMIALIPIMLFYNGEKGNKAGWVKKAFYAFYPVHLLILGAVVLFMRQ